MKFVFIKKAISIFLILLFCFNSFGLFFFYWGKIQQCKIKAEGYADAVYGIPEKSLNVFFSVNKNFELVNKNEILSGGKLYDIVRTEISDGKIIYYTLCDNDEDEYTRDLTDLEKSNSQEKSFPAKTIYVHIGKYFNYKKYTGIEFCFREYSNHENKFTKNIFFYKSPIRNIISPPPDHSLS